MMHIDAFQPTGNRLEPLLSSLLAVNESERLICSLYTALLNQAKDQTSELILVFRDALKDAQQRYDAITECYQRLSGKYIEKKQSSPSLIRLRADHLLKMLSDADVLLMQEYTDICTLSMDYDYRIFDLSYRNLYEKTHHLDRIRQVMRKETSSTFTTKNRMRYTL